jgi:hypothetical protein
MEIGCRLWRVETAGRARGESKLAVADRVRNVVADPIEGLDGCCDLYRADSERRGARSGSESVGARNVVGVNDRIAFLKKSRRLRNQATG